MTRVEAGGRSYEWIDDWATIPASESARRGWAHPGVAVTAAGDVFTFHQGDPRMLVFDRDGGLQRSFETGLTEGHGITLVDEAGTEYLWIADTGSKRDHRSGAAYSATNAIGQVVKMDLDGRIVQRIGQPDHAVYQEGRFSPTSVAVNEERWGGNGDVWVADGYGQSHVHRYSRFSKAGEYLGSIDGAEGPAGRFKTPHGLWFDRRKGEPELYVADRGNRRVQVYDPEGRFKRAFGEQFLSSPSAFAADGDVLVVAELRARLALLDRADHLIGYLGDDESVCARPGWPNAQNQAGEFVRTDQLVPGKFNSPHGLAADREGNLYVAEWLIGGRYTKLRKIR
jgi:DNA-binding beta-propeller fold protein YncE